ncbi:DUF305 domain-containing protein [Candidatus Parcubacteria bacterium]|uniref:DUF305 domain-containing protein n=1 Tax=Candidatus Kaiserbacteria bacterium CG10_big_fil_rev_8_21_14_0_10_47_16 TaxID=1974608 RepID=A0A2H0UEM7_9BACT|nr:DUF305 domain-containing protein [Candidatus Parcubacteria bacterium]PIR84869.1 MAG: DUF305 domain-containing protein [Candidatus Kaiserbacteria bacterium CG10_big_fil_rev_8_21_14_0_10_47_16]
MKQTTIIVLVLGALLLGGVVGVYMTTMSNQEPESNDSVAVMDHGDSMHVTSEKAFLEGMIPHHQEAIDTAREVLARGGTTEEIRTLATNVVAAQESEVASMKEWYRAWYDVPYTPSPMYMSMMRELEPLSGTAIDRAFLEDMIGHHQGAIAMAESVRPYIEHTEITLLANAVVETQTAEILEMKRLLSTLPE